MIYLLQPRSIGQATLVSRDPKDRPISQMNYFDSDSHDINTMMEGIRLVNKIYSTEPMRNTGVYSISNLSNDTQLKKYLLGTKDALANTNSGKHLVGTCKMGNDSMAVVHSRLRIRGIRGLRIADTSIMPFIISGNT